jgi:hypothetical protein
MMTYKWFKHFKNGRASTDDDDELTDQSSTSRLNGKEKSKIFLCNWSLVTYMRTSFFPVFCMSLSGLILLHEIQELITSYTF